MSLTRLDLPGRYEHEPDLRSGVKELNSAVVVRKSGSVRVFNGDVLRECEADGVVADGKRRELDGINVNLRVFRFKNGEINNENNYYKKDQENGCYNT